VIKIDVANTNQSSINLLPTLIYNTEKSLEEHKAKLPPAEVEEI